MTKQKLIELCERERDRGAATASGSRFDAGYAYAMKIIGNLAKELPPDRKENKKMRKESKLLSKEKEMQLKKQLKELKKQ